MRKLKAEVARRELEALLSGEADNNDCYLEVHAGAGGTESQDWASMLLRMYTRWAEQHGFKVDYIEETQGEEAGIKSATVEIKGRNAYGWLKTENGVHRLVRISPFDSNARRHTSFASVNVYPVVDDRIKIDINEVRRARRYHALRRRRRPARQQDRIRGPAHPHPDQYRGGVARATARSIATARRPGRCCAPSSTKLELKKREEKAAADQAAKTDIGWGHQIRSYVLQPYQMVKDLRTGVSTSNTARRARRRHRSVHRSGAGAESVRHRAGECRGRRVGGLVLNDAVAAADYLLPAAEQLVAGVEEFLRIDRFAVDAGLVMQMRAGRAAGRADLADDLADPDLVADTDVDLREVAVAGRPARCRGRSRPYCRSRRSSRRC